METTDTVSHLSIGEVLSQLQAEFPDVTISKIRFLEAQGLIDPERTPSGYRKFYELDVSRLKWILRQQRDHFLPLKVIKSKLEQGDVDFDSVVAVQPNLWSDSDDAPAARPRPEAAETPWKPAVPQSSNRSAAPAAPAPPPAATGVDAFPEEPPDPDEAAAHAAAERDGAAWLAALQESPKRPSAPPARPLDTAAVGVGRGVRFGLAEVIEVTGVDAEAIESMITYGLVTPLVIAGESTFDASSVAVVRSVAHFLARGVEPRHLRMFKNAAEREAGFYEQMILPLLKQRNPKAREQAADTLNELTAAGDELSRALVRQALRSHLGD
ncbi:MAG: MerR family DNA-binding transcriptional regulator [Acidimicrobiales bacterium]